MSGRFQIVSEMVRLFHNPADGYKSLRVVIGGLRSFDGGGGPGYLFPRDSLPASNHTPARPTHASFRPHCQRVFVWRVIQFAEHLVRA